MADTSDLTFDRAEYASSSAGGGGADAAPCGNCQKPLGEEYWQWQTHSVCARCRDVLASTLTASRSAGAFGKALVQGGLVALGCGVAYAVFVGVTNYQIAFATIGIGFIVAKVVRKASRGVGGVRFQVLAVVLTYLASTMGYMPGIWRGITHSASSAKHTASSSASPPATADHAGDAPTAPAEGADAKAGPKGEAAAPSPRFGVLDFVKLIAILLGIMLAAPFLEITEAPLGVLIVAFGLWEAWRLSRGVPLEVRGPFRVAAPPAPASPAS